MFKFILGAVAGYAAAWAQGQAMPLERVVAFALVT